MNLAQLIQSQNFARLLQALDAAGELTPGTTVRARLLSLDPDGTATAAIGEAKITLVLAGPQAKQALLQPGATLVLHLEAPEQPGGDLRATLVEIRPPAGSPAPSPTSPTPAPTLLPAAAAPAATAATATGNLAPPAAGGTPAASLPALAMRTAAAGAPEPAEIPSKPSSGTIPARPAEALPPAAPLSPRAAIGPTLGTALIRQDGLAPLFANLRSLAEGTVALALPKPLSGAIDQVLHQAFPAERQIVTGRRLQAALQGSGLFMEAHAVAGQAPAPHADLKAGLLALRETLLPLVDALSPQPPNGRPDHPAILPEPASDGTPSVAPPRRDGPLAAQPVAEPTLSPGEKPLAIAATLLGQTEAALDRIKLSQYASLPLDAPRLDPAQPQPQRWLAEIPLAFQHGTAILPLQVEKDPPRREAQGVAPPLWRIRFALDVEPMGPLQGVVTLRGREVGVTLWAEREETSRLLRGAAPGLETALLNVDFAAGTVDIHTGQPRVMQPTAGQFLDRLS